MTPSPRPARRRSCLGWLGLLGVLAFAAFMTTIVVTVTIWPGEARLTAPLFCDDDTPDAFVVEDQTRIEPGETAYDFSLYCMGPRGQTQEVGFFRPGLVLTVAHGAVIGLLVAALLLLVRRGRHRSPVDGAAAGP